MCREWYHFKAFDIEALKLFDKEHNGFVQGTTTTINKESTSTYVQKYEFQGGG